MNPISFNSREPEEIDAAAAHWVLRRDRGLTASEQDQFSQWLAADPQHGKALARQRWGWEELDRLTGLQTSLGAVPDPDLFAPRLSPARRLFRQLAPVTLAFAAVVALFFYIETKSGRERAMPPPTLVATPSSTLAAPCERQTLADGTTVELNRGSHLDISFTATERRVQLVDGEAHFTVAKNPARPFIVSAAGVEVRAIGTVFNVRMGRSAVEVLVSEGRVKVDPPIGHAPRADETFVSGGQQAIISLAPAAPAPSVATLTPEQIDERLAWRPQLLDFTATPLVEIVREFNRRNPVQIAIADPTLEALRLSASFRSDNVEGFVRLMESEFGMKADWRRDREILLRRAK